MSDKFVGINKGGSKQDVTSGTSDLSKHVQLKIDQSAGLDHLDVIRAVQNLLAKVEMDKSLVV